MIQLGSYPDESSTSVNDWPQDLETTRDKPPGVIMIRCYAYVGGG
jgi:hypothetical protein